MGFVTSPIIKKFGFKTIFVVTGFTYTLYCASFIQPSYRHEYPDNDGWYLSKIFIIAICILTALLNGAGQTVQFVMICDYIGDCANESNKGMYNGLFWCFQMSSGIVGNLMAAYVIVDVKESMFYVVMTALCLASNFVFLLTTKPDKEAARIAHITEMQV